MFISYSSGGWKVQDQGTSRFAVCWVPSSWWQGLAFLMYPQVEERKRLWSLVLFKVLVLVTQLYQTLCDPMTVACLSGFSAHGILQVKLLEWAAIPFSRGSSWPRDRTWVSFIAGGFFTIWATREALFPLFCICTNPIMEILSLWPHLNLVTPQSSSL